MAVVQGPLFSMRASGTIADQLIYSHIRGTAYVKSYKTPKTSRQGKQRTNQNLTRFLSQIYKQIQQASQAAWRQYMANVNASGYNGFVGYNIQRYNNFGYIATDPTTEMLSAGSAMTNLTAIAEHGSLAGAAQAEANETIWAIAIIGRPGTTSPGPADLLSIVPASPTGPTNWYAENLESGEYTISAFPINNDGVIGTFIPDQTVILP
jgi:hypothetical protein